MSTHDAEYFRQCCRAQGIPARDPFCALNFLERATELQSLKQLRWPRNLFGELASIAELMAESAHACEHTDNVCRRCGTRAVEGLMLSTSARKPARTGGTRSGGGERGG
jgi:hypothetical protein